MRPPFLLRSRMNVGGEAEVQTDRLHDPEHGALGVDIGRSEHAGHLGDLWRAIPGLVSSELLGEPSDDVRAKFVDSGVRLFTPFLYL